MPTDIDSASASDQQEPESLAPLPGSRQGNAAQTTPCRRRSQTHQPSESHSSPKGTRVNPSSVQISAAIEEEHVDRAQAAFDKVWLL